MEGRNRVNGALGRECESTSQVRVATNTAVDRWPKTPPDAQHWGRLNSRLCGQVSIHRAAYNGS
jgi:hypothetical protein